MLAETASSSCDCRPGFMCSVVMLPKERVRGSRVSTRIGSRSGSSGTR